MAKLHLLTDINGLQLRGALCSAGNGWGETLKGRVTAAFEFQPQGERMGADSHGSLERRGVLFPNTFLRPFKKDVC